MKYIFIHIGKTAGTSFRQFLESNVKRPYWGYAKLYFLTDKKDESEFHKVEPNGRLIFDYYNLFSEHFSYGLHPYLGKVEYQYIAVIRDPLSRTISQFNYGIDRGWYPKDANIIDWFMNDDPFLEHTRLDRSLYQLRHVSGLPIELPIEVQLNGALKNLKNDNFLFGFTEYYNEFIDLCCSVNGWKPKYNSINKTQNKHNISDKERGILMAELVNEYVFYEEARKVYNEKYKTHLKND